MGQIPTRTGVSVMCPLGPRRVAHRNPRERTWVCPVVPRNEGNEVIRKGCAGVLARHSTAEAGEPKPKGTRWRKGRGRERGIVGGQDDQDIETGKHLNATPANSKVMGARRCPSVCSEPSHLRNRMREIRTYGSVGAGGGQPPSATRKNGEALRGPGVGT